MRDFAPSSPVAIDFSLVGEGAVTQLRWRLLNAEQAVLQNWTTIQVDDPPPDMLTIEVDGTLNQLAVGESSTIRVIEMEVTTTEGIRVRSEPYLIKTDTILVIGVNSFQSYYTAAMNAAMMMDKHVEGWDEADRNSRELALVEAHSRVLRLPLRFVDGQGKLVDDQMNVRGIGTPNPDLLLLEPKLLTALRKAQVLEASELLSSDPVREARMNGVLSMTVGESSQFFRSARPLELPVGREALRVLGPWLVWSARFGRS